jgi:hypothetical protein
MDIPNDEQDLSAIIGKAKGQGGTAAVAPRQISLSHGLPIVAASRINVFADHYFVLRSICGIITNSPFGDK